MSESDFLMLQIELANFGWSVLSAWIGTTTVMIGAAYFVAARIKISLVIAMLSLYGIFTAACFVQLIRIWGRTQAIGEDLRAVQEGGAMLTQSALALIANIDSQLVVNVVQPLMIIGFVGSAVYIIYCYKGGGND